MAREKTWERKKKIKEARIVRYLCNFKGSSLNPEYMKYEADRYIDMIRTIDEIRVDIDDDGVKIGPDSQRLTDKEFIKVCLHLRGIVR